MKKIYALIALVLIVLTTSAQVPMRTLEPGEVKSSVNKVRLQPLLARINVTEEEVEKYKKEDIKEAELGFPTRFGISKAANLNPKNSGIWEETDLGRVWRLRIESPNAKSINLYLTNFFLKPGATVYIYTPDGRTLYGPLSEKQNNSSKEICTVPIPGEAIIVELFEPKAGSIESTIQINSVIHGYVPNAGFGESVACHNNVNCPGWESWQLQSDAVAMVLINYGTRWCSSSLINNTCQNWIPYVLTAFHCIDYLPFDGVIDANEANQLQSMTFMFQYKSPTCTSQDATNVLSINGANLRSSWVESDFALIQLSSNPSTYLVNNPPRSPVYAGWSRNNGGPNSAVGIHHPNGDVMKISQDNNAVTSITNNFFVGGSAHSYDGNRFWRPVFDSGTVQGGSSGSPLFNPEGRIIGQLFASANGNRCELRDGIYGRFDASWDGGGTPQTRLRDWLDPSNSGAVNLDLLQQPYNLPHTWVISGPNQVNCSQTSYFGSFFWPSNNYIWTVSPNLQIVNGQGSPSAGISANTTAGGTGTITLRIGCATAPVVATLNVNIASCGGRIGISEITSDQQMTAEKLVVYPNPAKQELHIKFLSGEAANAQIEIVDQSGKKAFISSINTVEGLNDNIIRLPHQLQGQYILKLKTSNKTITEKVLFDF